VQESTSLLSGDVEVEIEWHIAERIRYETDASADVDNILKPVLDGMSGPQGILIDDSQVQRLVCSWKDAYTDSERFTIELRSHPDYILSKEDLVFVQFQGPLCSPTFDIGRPDILWGVAELVAEKFARRDELMKGGASLSEAQVGLPIQRVFHRSRLSGFKVIRLDELRARYQGADWRSMFGPRDLSPPAPGA
jgi:hypothetical protein